MSKIIVVGSLNMDLVINTAKVPVMGETVLGNGFMTAPGGKGANQAVAASKLGGEVLMIGCIGNDAFGKELIDNLERNKVHTKYIKILNGISTGIAVIVVKDGNNFIIVDPGANFKLTPEMIYELENVIKNTSFLVIQLEIPIETVEAAISIAAKHGVRVVLNPAPAMKLTDEFLSKVDILVLNETESQIITGIEVEGVEDAKKVVSAAKKIGVRQVIVTIGKNGAVYNRENEIIHTPVPKVEVIDTTAAGDSFIGAVVVALSQGKGIDEAVYYANMVGALTVTKKGAQTSLPDKKDVEDFMAKISFAN